ncbi:MAG TPA: biosynthetic peptidoglycan transglycosylase, partial [Caldisericia bacterium]|nr:biosynthetic peptidoglycan transglycosylase [Caldisericia bacterium]
MFYQRKIVSKNREKRKDSKKSFNKKRAILIFLIIIAFLFSSIFIYAFSYYKYIITFLPKIEEIHFDPPESSEIYDRKGNLIKTVYFIENRINIPLNELPEYFIDALIASEDERFYTHKGVDFKSLIRASIINFRQKRIVEGGSTITMQLARELFLSKEVTLERKFKEMILALRLENIYSKEEILTYYVNQIFFG